MINVQRACVWDKTHYRAVVSTGWAYIGYRDLSNTGAILQLTHSKYDTSV